MHPRRRVSQLQVSAISPHRLPAAHIHSPARNALVFSPRLNSHRPPLKCPHHFVAHVTLHPSRGPHVSVPHGVSTPFRPCREQTRLVSQMTFLIFKLVYNFRCPDGLSSGVSGLRFYSGFFQLFNPHSMWTRCERVAASSRDRPSQRRSWDALFAPRSI